LVIGTWDLIFDFKNVTEKSLCVNVQAGERVMQKKKVAVLMGGRSAEREISLKTGSQVCEALSRQGYSAAKIDVDENVWENLKKAQPDVVFIALHGRLGEDGTIQGMLELLGIPYTGSGVLASALGIDKIMSKRIFKAEGISTPEFTTLSKDDFNSNDLPETVRKLAESPGFPMVVKPCREGSTIGLSVITKEEDVEGALREAFRYDDELLIEQFINGREVTVGILGNRDPIALPTLEVISKKELYDFEAKYTPGMSEHIIPARFPEEQRKNMQKLALCAHQALNCRGFSRVDLIVTPDGFSYVLEVNTIPGMTGVSLYPDAARAAGIEFADLVSRLVELALED
jgi:D-alanine-D-alanine ligase